MASKWSNPVLYSTDISVPVKRNDAGQVLPAAAYAESKRYIWQLSLCETQRDSDDSPDLLIECVSLRNVHVCGPERFPFHQRVLIEVVGADAPVRNISLWWHVNDWSSSVITDPDETRDWNLSWKCKGWNQWLKNISSITVKVTIVSAPDSDSVYLNRQIKMFEDGKIHGDMTLRVHIAPEGEDDFDPTPPPSKRRKVLSSDNSSQKAEASSDTIELKTYSAVLRCASPYFTSLFCSNMKEADEMVMDIHAECIDDVEGMLFFLFTNQFMEEPRSLAMIRLAHLYQCKGLFDRLSEDLAKNLTVANYAEVFKVYERYEIEKGMDTLIGFGKAHIGKLKKDQSFGELPFVFRTGLLKRDDTIVFDSNRHKNKQTSVYCPMEDEIK